MKNTKTNINTKQKLTSIENRGGTRVGSGRPTKEKTVVMRIPISMVEEIKMLISK